MDCCTGQLPAGHRLRRLTGRGRDRSAGPREGSAAVSAKTVGCALVYVLKKKNVNDSNTLKKQFIIFYNNLPPSVATLIRERHDLPEVLSVL